MHQSHNTYVCSCFFAIRIRITAQQRIAYCTKCELTNWITLEFDVCVAGKRCQNAFGQMWHSSDNFPSYLSTTHWRCTTLTEHLGISFKNKRIEITHNYKLTILIFIFVQSRFAVNIKYRQTGWFNLNEKNKQITWVQNNCIHMNLGCCCFCCCCCYLLFQNKILLCCDFKNGDSLVWKKHEQKNSAHPLWSCRHTCQIGKKKNWIIAMHHIARLWIGGIKFRVKYKTKKSRKCSLYMTQTYANDMLIPSHNIIDCKRVLILQTFVSQCVCVCVCIF